MEKILWIKVSGHKWGTGEGGHIVESIEHAVQEIVNRHRGDTENLVYYIEEDGQTLISSRKLKNLVRKANREKIMN